MNLSELTDQIRTLSRTADDPITVGISGFGGSGKSSLASALTSALPSCISMRGDDFLDPTRTHQRSKNWDGVERARLVSQVLSPFRSGRSSTFRRFDWRIRALGEPEPVPRGDIILVDLIGLFHPETEPHLDMRVWCDVDIATSTAWGKARDVRLGRDHTKLWDEIWVPNEIDFVAAFQPRRMADLIVPPVLLEQYASS